MCSLKMIPAELPRYLGKRLLEKRNRLGLSLAEAAAKIDLSPQQLQKYECVGSTVAASRLYQISCLFGVSIDYFFYGFKSNAHRAGNLTAIPNRPVQLRALNIVLIEDDDSDAYLTQKVAKSSSVDVDILVMSDDRELFRFLRNQTTHIRFPRPDLILLDLNLPKIDGFSILHTLKHDRMLSDIPVVILSNSFSKHDMIRCYQNHAAGFITKPFDFEVFQQKFDRLAHYWAQARALFKQTAVTINEIQDQTAK